jgi:hypothetical protein
MTLLSRYKLNRPIWKLLIIEKEGNSMKIKKFKYAGKALFCMMVIALLGFNPISAGAYDDPDDFTVAGKIGIGTETPAGALHIKDNNTTNPSTSLILESEAQNAVPIKMCGEFGEYYSCGKIGYDSNNEWFTFDRLIMAKGGISFRSWREHIISPAAQELMIKAKSKLTLETGSGSETGNVIITNSNVGIGTTTTPDSKLHVVGDGHFTGDLTVDGNIAAKYQDLAEYVKTSEILTPGMVVMIDHENNDQVLPSEKAYNTLVAGVVSQMPGIILGEGGADKAQIAHTGRVKVKVDTSYGAISRGDLLVTSPVKGFAMKADSDKLNPGMLLGKALEPLDQGKRGKILALITLQ